MSKKNTVANEPIEMNAVLRKPVLRVLVTSGSDTRQTKTSTATHGIKPFLENYYDEVDLWGVELEAHARGVESRLYLPSDIETLAKDLTYARPTVPGGRRALIVDLGGDLFRDLMSEMEAIDGGGLKFDVVIYPITTTADVRKFETMLLSLIDAGIELSTVHVVFNLIKKEDAKSGFQGITKKFQALGNIAALGRKMGVNVSEAFIQENGLQSQLTQLEMEADESGSLQLKYPELSSMHRLAKSEIDYEGLANKALDENDTETFDRMSKMGYWKQNAIIASKQYALAMQKVFEG